MLVQPHDVGQADDHALLLVNLRDNVAFADAELGEALLLLATTDLEGRELHARGIHKAASIVEDALQSETRQGHWSPPLKLPHPGLIQMGSEGRGKETEQAIYCLIEWRYVSWCLAKEARDLR